MTAPEPRDGDSAALLAVLDALLGLAGDAAARATLLRRARDFFVCDRALLLQPDGDTLRCVAADPAEPAETQWPDAAALLAAVRSRVIALAGAPSEARTLLPPDLVAPGAPSLMLPVALAGRAAVLLLRRDAGAADFAADSVTS